MFENVATEELLSQLAVHDFDDVVDPMGGDRIDAIRAYDRVIRAAQAEQTAQIAALDASRTHQSTVRQANRA